jgi:hypothetical protein
MATATAIITNATATAVKNLDELMEYPPLVRGLSGVISEEDIKELSLKDERVRYILKEN